MTWELHHRLPGGMGGSSRDRDVPSNLLALIPWHHNMLPGSVHMVPKLSRENGWLISTHDSRPFTQVPVLYRGKDWALLDDDGGHLVRK